MIGANEIAPPERLFVFRVGKRYPDRAKFRRFVMTVKKTGSYYDHDMEARTVTVVFESRESRDIGVRLLKSQLKLQGEDFT